MQRRYDNSLQLSLDFESVENQDATPIMFSNNKSRRQIVIDDFGEKIGGAKKDLAAAYLARISTIDNELLISKPFAQAFPRPDVTKLVRRGVLTRENALWIKYIYDNIPVKPSSRHKLSLWIDRVRDVMRIINYLISNNPVGDELRNGAYNYRSEGDIAGALKMETYIMLADIINFPENDFNIRKYTIKYSDINSNYCLLQSSYIIKRDCTFVEAVEEIKRQITQTNKNTKKVALAIYQNRQTKDIFIGKKQSNPTVLQGGFKSAAEASLYLTDHRNELEDLWHRINVRPEERRSTNRARIGFDWRKGYPVTPTTFLNTFGFRGVEFGNWVNNKERQVALNEAYDSLMDLSFIIGKSPQAISLNGELALAFGARGAGRYSAHYESYKVVINLTKTKGAGSLAHEWFHALDNYFSRKRGQAHEFLTRRPSELLHRKTKDNTRMELLGVMNSLVQSIMQSDMRKRSAYLDVNREKPYWSDIIEMGARAFENYLMTKLSESGYVNDYLANFKQISEWEADKFEVQKYPYPNVDESLLFNEKFDQLFNTIQEQIDNKTRKTLLFKESMFFSNAENAVLKINQQRATAEQWLAMIRKSGGIKASEDKWMGLSEWLNKDMDAMLTKDEVLQFITTNKIECKEVLLENIGASMEWDHVVSSDIDYYTMTYNEQEYIILPMKDDFTILDNSSIIGVKQSLDEAKGFVEGLCDKQDVTLDSTQDVIRSSSYTTAHLTNLKALILTSPLTQGWNQEDVAHYGDIDEGKAIAWIRFGETIDNQGRRVLVLDEIQSTRHQNGREFGYRDAEVERDIVSLLSDNTVSKKVIKERLIEYNEMPPPAPFEKTWHELAFKRMLRYAAERNYDAVAWTTGEQLYNRYNFNRHARLIEYKPLNLTSFPGVITISYDRNEPKQTKYIADPSALEALVGDKITAKIMEGHCKIKNVKFKAGPQGMKGFYDKILVDFAKHYIKRWEGRVEDVALPIGDNKESIMHTLLVTDSMKESVMQGQPMFMELDQTGLDVELRDKITTVITELSDKLNTPVVLAPELKDLPLRIFQIVNDRKNSNKNEGSRYPGVYDPETGQVYFILNDIKSEAEAEKCFLHEVIAHKGIEGLLGRTKALIFYDRVFNGLDQDTQRNLLRRYKNKQTAGAEYVAMIAEENRSPSALSRIVSIFKEILSSVGIRLRINNEDIRVVLACSKQHLTKQEKISSSLGQQHSSGSKNTNRKYKLTV